MIPPTQDILLSPGILHPNWPSVSSTLIEDRILVHFERPHSLTSNV
jgi:hypothetical protein